MKKSELIAGLLGVVMLASLSWGQSEAEEARRARIGQVKKELNGGSEQQLEAACGNIRAMLEARDYPSELRSSWLPTLAKKGRSKEVAELTLIAMAQSPDGKTSYAMMALRAHALLDAGDKEGALNSAKMAYLTCDIASTEAAIKLLCEIVKATRSDSAATALRFEIVGWGEANSWNDLGEVTLDRKAFKDEIGQLGSAMSTSEKIKLGNLELAMGQFDDAMNVFQGLWDRTEGREKALAGEGIARVLKAKHVSMREANEWLEKMCKGREPEADIQLP